MVTKVWCAFLEVMPNVLVGIVGVELKRWDSAARSRSRIVRVPEEEGGRTWSISVGLAVVCATESEVVRSCWRREGAVEITSLRVVRLPEALETMTSTVLAAEMRERGLTTKLDCAEGGSKGC